MLLDTILKGNPPSIIPANFGLIWFSGFSREDLDVICYQNMHNLHNGYKLVKRKISQKKIENIKLLIDTQLQLKFELFLIYNKATMNN